MNPQLFESKEKPYILIVDRKGIIGSELSKKLLGDAQIVFVSEKYLDTENIINIPFAKKIPIIPESLYSHIFVIDDGEKITRESLSSFLNKAKNDKSILIIATHIKNQTLIKNEFNYKGLKIVFFGDIAETQIPTASYINRFINQAREGKKIKIPGDGMNLTYPIFFEDLISGILEAAFGTSSENTYYLLPKSGITLLSLAHSIQKTNPLVKIDFIKEEQNEKIVFIKDGKYLLPDNYSLEKKIRNLNLEKKQTAEIYKEKFKAKSNRNIKTTLFFLILFIFMPLITTIIFISLGTIFLNSTKISLNTGNLDNAEKSVGVAQSFFIFSKKTSNFFTWETNGLSKPLYEISNNNYKITNGLNDFFQGVKLLNENKSDRAIEYFKSFLIFAQNEKTKKNNLVFFGNNLFTLSSSTVDVWPSVLGYNTPKTYLILLQNNLKLSPTGGIIESYGILTINKGKIEKFDIKNTYDYDNKLIGRVDPPFAIRRFLGEKNWNLKNSNFDINFINSASSAAFFANLETQEKIDGVLALDLNFVKEILKITGPIDLDIYKKSINSENIFLFAKEKNLDKNFSTSILNTLKKLFETKKIPYLKFANLVADQALKKSILFASPSLDVQNILTVNNLSDSLWDQRTNEPKNINDSVGVNEANFGKSLSTEITKKISQEIEIKENGETTSKLSIEFKNFGNQEYKNYLRFILPSPIEFKSVKIDGETKEVINAITDPAIYEEKNFKVPNALEIESHNQDNKTILGFLITIPKDKLQTIEINYNFSQKQQPLFVGELFYSLHFFKQPGVDDYPYNLNLYYPKKLKVVSFLNGVNNLNNKISFSRNVSEDFDLNLNFSQK